MELKKILQGIKYITQDRLEEVEIQGLSADSKNIRDNFIFIAVKGHRFDGHKFITEAISRGARAVIGQDNFPSSGEINPALRSFQNQGIVPGGVKKILVEDTRLILSKLASNFLNHPSEKIKAMGVTGTNGKTTITYLLDNILNKAGFKVGLIGTIQYRLNDRVIPAGNTTPGAIEMQSFLKEMADNHLDYMVIEVSSHSLDQHRVEEIYFDSAIFTNLTLDHLDYHLNFENYFLAKAKLFEKLKPQGKAIINIDDPYGIRLKSMIKNDIFTYSISQKADIAASHIKLNLEGSAFLVNTPAGSFEVESNFIGLYNVSNLLAAAGAALSQNISLDIIKQALNQNAVVPGRLEPVEEEQPFRVFIDYAHTDQALKNVLSILKKVKKRRILLLFGCGGDRDRSKRPLMAQVAAELADWVVITSDNPRREDPGQIIKEIEQGLPKGFKNYSKILDREQAIEKIISMAQENDIILMAGKGHENYQIFKDLIIPFNDKEVARRYINQLYPKATVPSF